MSVDLEMSAKCQVKAYDTYRIRVITFTNHADDTRIFSELHPPTRMARVGLPPSFSRFFRAAEDEQSKLSFYTKETKWGNMGHGWMEV